MRLLGWLSARGDGSFLVSAMFYASVSRRDKLVKPRHSSEPYLRAQVDSKLELLQCCAVLVDCDVH